MSSEATLRLGDKFVVFALDGLYVGWGKKWREVSSSYGFHEVRQYSSWVEKEAALFTDKSVVIIVADLDDSTTAKSLREVGLDEHNKDVVKICFFAFTGSNYHREPFIEDADTCFLFRKSGIDDTSTIEAMIEAAVDFMLPQLVLSPIAFDPDSYHAVFSGLNNKGYVIAKSFDLADLYHSSFAVDGFDEAAKFYSFVLPEEAQIKDLNKCLESVMVEKSVFGAVWNKNCDKCRVSGYFVEN